MPKSDWSLSSLWPLLNQPVLTVCGLAPGCKQLHRLKPATAELVSSHDIGAVLVCCMSQAEHARLSMQGLDPCLTCNKTAPGFVSEAAHHAALGWVWGPVHVCQHGLCSKAVLHC